MMVWYDRRRKDPKHNMRFMLFCVAEICLHIHSLRVKRKPESGLVLLYDISSHSHSLFLYRQGVDHPLCMFFNGWMQYWMRKERKKRGVRVFEELLPFKSHDFNPR